MKVIKNIFIFLFFFFTPVFFFGSAYPIWLRMIILFSFWGFLFIWILNGLWSLFFAKSIRESFFEYFPNFKLIASIPYIFIGLVLLITPVFLINNPVTEVYAIFVLILFWGAPLLFISIKLANSLLKNFGTKLDEIFPAINNNKNLFLIVTLYVSLIVSAIFFIGQNEIDTGYNLWLFVLLSLAAFVWSLTIAYKFFKAVTQNGSIVVLVILVMIIMYIFAVLNQPGNQTSPSKTQEYKEIICEVTDDC